MEEAGDWRPRPGRRRALRPARHQREPGAVNRLSTRFVMHSLDPRDPDARGISETPMKCLILKCIARCHHMDSLNANARASTKPSELQSILSWRRNGKPREGKRWLTC